MKVLAALTIVGVLCTLVAASGYRYNGARYGSGNYGQHSSNGGYSRYGSSNYGSNYRNNRYGYSNRYGYRRVRCPKLPDPANGDVKLSGIYVGSRASYSCDAGFELSGNSAVRKCQSNGRWSGSAPSCQRVDCGDLDDINNGRVSISPDSRFGSTATYSCNRGFQLAGASQRRCQANANWSGREPACIRVDCGDLDDINNGQVTISPDTRFGSTATYTCRTGFQLSGASQRRCQADANWSGNEPVCIRVDCGDLDDINNGQVTISPDTRFGSTATYTCRAGFRLSGANRRRCQADGNWSGREPACIRVDCGDLDDISNGRVTISPDTRFGSTATYTCRAGFRLSGASQRRCQANANWSGREPVCIRVDCGDLDDISNGRVTISPDTRFGSTATYTCRPGFQLVGTSQRRCQADANWSGNEPACIRVDCGDLDDIINGRVTISPDTRFGSTATYTCNPGFQLVGPNPRRCQADANWSGVEPTCIRVNCGSLNDIANGRVDIQPDTSFQSTATYSCNPGFKLDGNRVRTCLASGSWSGAEPSCERIDCGPLRDIENGQVVIAPDTKFLSIATYTCNPGFVIDDERNRRRRCEASGEYSGEEPTCIPVSCGSLGDIKNGRVILTGTEFGDTATYICNPGFRLIGDRLRRCRANGEWSSTAPTCAVIDCGTLPAPENGAVILNPGSTFGSTATYRCRKGFILVGSKERLCQANGQWSASQPTCRRVLCPKLAAPANGKLRLSKDYYPGDYAYFSCAYGYSIIGRSRIVCLHTGVWSHHIPSCQKDAYPVPDDKYEYGHNKYDGPKLKEHDDYYDDY